MARKESQFSMLSVHLTFVNAYNLKYNSSTHTFAMDPEDPDSTEGYEVNTLNFKQKARKENST